MGGTLDLGTQITTKLILVDSCPIYAPPATGGKILHILLVWYPIHYSSISRRVPSHHGKYGMVNFLTVIKQCVDMDR